MFRNERAQVGIEVDVAELHRREIYRNFQIGPALWSPSSRDRGPIPRAREEDRNFGDGDELRGRYLAVHRMIPTQ